VQFDRRAARSSARRRCRPSSYRSSNVRRPIGAASAGSGVDPPVGMPRASNSRWWRGGSRNRQLLRRVDGNRKYGCQPKATGTGRRPVGMTVVSTFNRVSAAVTLSSMRWGNGNAGASTSIAAWSQAVSP
jgi:hypothetical protein